MIVGARSQVLGVRTINLIVFIGFQFFWHMYHLGEDLGWDWIWASCLIECAQNGWSFDLGIFGIPDVNCPARAFKLILYRDLLRTQDISPRFCWITIFVFFPNFFTFFFMNLGARSQVLGVQTINLIVFIGFQIFLTYVSLGWRSWMWLNMSIVPHQICTKWLVMWLRHFWHSWCQLSS